jgi:agmatine deiminase
MMQLPYRFDYVPYPLWRRKLPDAIRSFVPNVLRSLYPIEADTNPPQTPNDLAAYMARWGVLPRGMSADAAAQALAADDQPIEMSENTAPPASHPTAVRLPAQWEPMERIILSFPVLYAPLWRVHAQMIEAITPVADVTVMITAPIWARAVRLYLRERGMADMARVHFLCVPHDDIWVRDYGPFVGLDEQGKQVVVKGDFAPLDAYPQALDDAFALRWATERGLPVRRLNLLTEGGNYWSDGAGTLLMSDEVLERHAELGQAEIERRLHEAFDFEKLIIVPRLLKEETGHIDLVCKLADAQTLLVNLPNGTFNDTRLEEAAAILRSATNAHGQPYHVIELPFPPMYTNWFVYPVWRTYTNSLTVNGRVLVPIFGLHTDMIALERYRAAMPTHEIIPIDCSATANGGGAVHCLTKEVARGK